jgi:thiol-disulfide isomerase/thioredoxin
MLILALFTGLSFTNPPKFHITGQLTGGMEGMKVYLKYADVPMTESTNLDSTHLHNGRFEFTGSTPAPRFYQILFRDPVKNPQVDYYDKIVDLFVENSNISIQAVYDSLPEAVYGWGGFNKPGAVTVKGSSSHEFFLNFDKGKADLEKQHSALFDEYIRFLNPSAGAAKQPRSVGMALARRMDVVDSARKAYVMDFIKNNNSSNEVVAYIAMRALGMSNTNTSDIDWMVGHFESAKEKGTLIQKFLADAPQAEKIVVGSSLVDFTMQDTSGNAHTLSDYIGKGKYVLLECWASWCHPCRADIPHLKEVYSLYHPYGFEIISVSLDDKRANWTKAIDQEKMEWLQLSDLKAFNGPLPKTYRINGIPDCLLFDPQGKLVTRNMRGSWMDRRLIEMYGDKF